MIYWLSALNRPIDELTYDKYIYCNCCGLIKGCKHCLEDKKHEKSDYYVQYFSQADVDKGIIKDLFEHMEK